MSYACESTVQGTIYTETGSVDVPVCTAWVEIPDKGSNSLLPELTAKDRDALLQFALEILIAIFVYSMIRKVFNI